MKKLTTLFALVVILALLAGSASAQPVAGPRDRAGCILELRATMGLGYQIPGLIVMFDGDYEGYRTSADDWTRIGLAVDPNYTHVIQLLDGKTPGGVWGAGVTCVTPGVIRLEAFVR